MKKNNKTIAALLFAISLASCTNTTDHIETICNPLNIGYQFETKGTLRRDISTPCIVLYKDAYYLCR